MRVRYLGDSGKSYIWHPTGSEHNNPSMLHIKVRELLKRMFPTVTILEEVSIEVMPFKTLFLDFYLPVLYYAIEVHGEQHYKFIEHYHQTRQNFMLSRKNDILKKDWCILNDLIFIELPFNKEEEWENLING